MDSTMTDQTDLLAAITAALRRERIEQQMSQEDLAAKAHLSPSPVRRLEQGQGVQLSAFLALVDALGLSERLLDLFPDQVVDSRQMAESGLGAAPARKRVSRTRESRPPRATVSFPSSSGGDERVGM
jgi:transcriptional regulator with XRE-family HTH domain